MTKDRQSILELLLKVRSGEATPEEALLSLQKEPFENLGYARVDHHRNLRQGFPEVIYGAGKTPQQILGIASAMLKKGFSDILITRISEDVADFLSSSGLDTEYHNSARICVVNRNLQKIKSGSVVIVCAGTSDIPIAEESAITAELFGSNVTRVYDAGVSGIHRLLSEIDTLLKARVIIAVAGMEGALPSVVGGLVACPVIAVPTSIGYGANFNGLSALLSMLNSCSAGISVVNIDNGFGAGYIANMINCMDGVK